MVRFIAVNDDVRSARLSARQRNGIGGANRQGGAESNHKVAGCRGSKGTRQISFAQVLAKTDGGGF